MQSPMHASEGRQMCMQASQSSRLSGKPQAGSCGPFRDDFDLVMIARDTAVCCPGLDPERAYVYGLLHDIGRKFGITGLAHVYDGYRYLSEMGYANAARIALTHSFNLKDIHDYIGKSDVTKSVQDEIQALLAGMEYNDYDCLIQLCDSLAKADGIVSVEERMNDVKSRHGYYPQKKWDMNLRLKEYFEEKMQEELYQVVCISGDVV